MTKRLILRKMMMIKMSKKILVPKNQPKRLRKRRKKVMKNMLKVLKDIHNLTKISLLLTTK